MTMTTLAALTGAVFLTFTPIYDEDEVPDYTLPDPLVTEDGETVDSPEMWREARRPETFALFEEHVYGRWLPDPEYMRFDVVDDEPEALDGKATRRQIVIHFTEEDERPSIELLLYLPNDVERPVPMFLYLSFWGNQAIHEDPEIRLSQRWMRGHGAGVENNRATEASRGTSTQTVPLETILERGYGLATFYYGDVALDLEDRYREDILSLFQDVDEERGPTDAGAIGAWAWGLSRAMDYLETDGEADHERTAVIGLSRLGKTTLWAGAGDERYAITISNNSGCGGAALFRRRFGERISLLNDVRPHWFCIQFRDYNDREDALPVDQHQLLALAAPRAVYVASATEDLPADPRGEFLAAYHAGPVYELFGEAPLPVDEMPGPAEPAHGTVGFHLRDGGHSLTPEDWAHFLDFANKHFDR